jgi:hypothetical protein
MKCDDSILLNLYRCHLPSKRKNLQKGLAVLDRIHTYFYLIILLLLGALVSQYGYYMIHNAGFVFGDQSTLLHIIMDNNMFVIIGNGRFSPLGLREYQPYLMSGANADVIIASIQLHNFIKLILFIFFTWLGLKKIMRPILATCTCLIILMTVHLFLMYATVQAQENTMITLWALWFVSFVYACQSDKGIYFILAALSASVAFYIKETAFALFFPASFALLIFNFNQLTVKARRYHWAIIAQMIIFLALYYWFAYRETTVFYNVGRTELSRLEIIWRYMYLNPLIILGCGLMLGRIITCVIKRRLNISMADVLLINALSFIAAYVALRLDAGYYIIPAEAPLLISLLLYLYKCWETGVMQKISNRFSKLKLYFILTMLGCAVLALAIPSYRDIHADMLNIQNLRQVTRDTVNELTTLKAEGYHFITYQPRPEYFADNPFRWHVHMWQWHTLISFIAFFSNDYDYKAPACETMTSIPPASSI